jgi:hypothetical protein
MIGRTVERDAGFGQSPDGVGECSAVGIADGDVVEAGRAGWRR